MTSNRLPKWQQALNQKLVQRLNEPLTEPGIINNQMARKIIDRSPDLLDRLPLLAQQMQRWSTIVDIQSEQTPIVYVQHQEAKQNPSLPFSDTNPGKKQLPVVKAKLVQVNPPSPYQNQELPLVDADARSQPTAPALTQDNSLPSLPNKISSIAESSATNVISNKSDISDSSNPSISVTPISEGSVNPIQRKLESESLSNNIDRPTPPSISITPISADATSPIQRKLESEQLLSQPNESSDLETEMPVVYERSQPNLSDSLSEIPLVKLSNNIFPTSESSSNDIDRPNSPSISVTPISADVTNPIQRKLESEQLSQPNLEQEMPVVYERSQPNLSEGISEIPLVNLSNNISQTGESSSTATSSSVTPISEGSVNPIQRKLEGEQLSQPNQLIKLEPEMPVVYERSRPNLSDSLPETPLVNLSNTVSQPSESSSNSPSISITPIGADATNPIQRKLESEQLSQPNQLIKLEPEMPVVYERSRPNLSESLPETPLVNLSNTVSQSSESSSISVTPIGADATNPIQRKLESEQFLQPNQLIKLEPEMPVVFERSQPNLSETIPETPLVNLSNTISQSSESSSISVTPIGADTINPIQRKLESEQLSQPNQLIKLEPEMPVVFERTRPNLSETIPEKPLVNLSNTVSQLSESSSNTVDRPTSPPTPIVPIRQISTTSIQRKFDDSAVVYSQPLSPKLASIEPTLLIQNFEKNNSSVASKQVQNTPQTPIVNPQSNPQTDNLPIVEVSLERSPPEFEPLILSAYPIAKQKTSSFNGNELNTKKTSIAPPKYHGTPSTNYETSIANSNPANRAIASTSGRNSQLPQVNQTTQKSLAGVNLPPQIDVDALADKVERKIMRRLVVESERRGKKKWR